MLRKSFVFVLAMVCFFTVNIIKAGADELVITEAGTQRYKAIKKALFNERTEATLVDHLRSQGFSTEDVALASSYFLYEVQEERENPEPVYNLKGIYSETDKGMVEGILESLLYFQGLKSTVDIYESVDIVKDIPKPENREKFLKIREDVRKCFEEYKEVYFKESFHLDWINHVALAMGESLEEVLGFNPNSAPENTEWPEWPEVPKG